MLHRLRSRFRSRWHTSCDSNRPDRRDASSVNSSPSNVNSIFRLSLSSNSSLSFDLNILLSRSIEYQTNLIVLFRASRPVVPHKSSRTTSSNMLFLSSGPRVSVFRAILRDSLSAFNSSCFCDSLSCDECLCGSRSCCCS